MNEKFMRYIEAWCDEYRIETCLKTLSARKSRSNPACINLVYLYYEDNNKCFVHPEQLAIANSSNKRIHDRMLSTYNPVATTGAAFYKMSALQKLPRDRLELPWSEWLLHFMLSWQGDIILIPKAMTVYRIHSKGTWSGGARKSGPDDDMLRLLQYIDEKKPGIYRDDLEVFVKRFFP